MSTESLSWHDAAGRVLAEPIAADRDSPPCDNMPARWTDTPCRLADVRPEGVPIGGEVLIGCPPPALPPGQALRIVTARRCRPALKR